MWSNSFTAATADRVDQSSGSHARPRSSLCAGQPEGACEFLRLGRNLKTCLAGSRLSALPGGAVPVSTPSSRVLWPAPIPAQRSFAASARRVREETTYETVEGLLPKLSGPIVLFHRPF